MLCNQRFCINAWMHCHRFECSLCIKGFLSVWQLSKKDGETLKSELPFIHVSTPDQNKAHLAGWEAYILRSFFQLNWRWIDQTFGTLQSLHLKMGGDHFKSHVHNGDTSTCDSALQQVYSQCWQTRFFTTRWMRYKWWNGDFVSYFLCFGFVKSQRKRWRCCCPHNLFKYIEVKWGKAERVTKSRA